MTEQRKCNQAGDREERRAQDRKRVKDAAEQLLSSEGWQRWVRVRAQGGLARLSVSNQLLVALSRPDATFVAGFRAAIACARGEKAIRIVAPMAIKARESEKRDEDAGPRVLFKGVSVFDRAQVSVLESGTPTPLEAPCEPLTGDSHAHLLEPLAAFAATLGYSVSFEAIKGATGGWCDAKAKCIVVDSGAPANARLRTLIHETIHALGVGYAEYGRERAEVIVDTATWLAAASVGLDVSGEAIAYVAGWGEDGALEAVTEFAKTIDGVARQVEDVLRAVGPQLPKLARAT